MDDAKIDLIAREVLTSLKKSRPAHTDSPPPSSEPSLRLLSVVGGVPGQPCVIEPDKPCVGSLKCRSFGH